MSDKKKRARKVRYVGMHGRLARVFGPARQHTCTSCQQPAAQWAYDHTDRNEHWDTIIVKGQPCRVAYSRDLDRYIPLCQSCHKVFDLINRPATPCVVHDCERIGINTGGLCCVHYTEPPDEPENAQPTLAPSDEDEYGLTERDHEVLRVLIGGWYGNDHGFRGGPIGISSLATALGIRSTELANNIEPRLIRAGLLVLRRQGRCATRTTYELLNIPVPPMINGWR